MSRDSPGPGAGSTQLDTRTGPRFFLTDGSRARHPGDERVAEDFFRELIDAGRQNHVTLSFTLIFKAIRHSSAIILKIIVSLLR